MDIAALRRFATEQLTLRANREDAGPMAAYMKTEMPFLGVRSPARREVERELRARAHLHEKEFFIRKAIGWALRQYSYVEPDAVAAFLNEHRAAMSGLTWREGSKQLRRSGVLA